VNVGGLHKIKTLMPIDKLGGITTSMSKILDTSYPLEIVVVDGRDGEVER